MSEHVQGRGPLDAAICVIGEAPGRQEMVQGLPFVGPSGRLQDEWIREAGLDPGLIRFENVVPFMPPSGDISKMALQEIQAWQGDCLARLDDLTGLRVIVPTGNVALSTLLGCLPNQARITQRRGSIYLWEHVSGRKIKVISVIHPAAVLRQEGESTEEGGQVVKKNYEARCRADWKRVEDERWKGIADTPPQRQLEVQPSPARFEKVIEWMLHGQEPLAFDIETNPEAGKILCISFATHAGYAVSVPWSRQYKAGIRALLESPLAKITHNGHYDYYWLAREGFFVKNWQWDTMAMLCLLSPGEPKSLAYAASMHTREPWYKGGDEDTGEKHWKIGDGNLSRWHALLEYNARDAAVTWEVCLRLVALLHEKGWMQVYQEQYQALFMPILGAMLHGMRVDEGELSAAFKEAIDRAHASLAQASQAAGRALFKFNTQVQEAVYRVALREWDRDDPDVLKKLKKAKGDEAKYIAQVEAKGISTQILAEVLYKDFKMPVQRMRRTKRVTTGEAALLKLRARLKDKGKFPAGMDLIEAVLGYREQKKQSEFLNPGRLDEDGRFRASYSFRPTTGRLSSASNPQGTGGNAQNIDRQLRGPFKPDKGCVLVEVDLSQAEARVVYCLTRDKQLIEMAHARPGKFDVHSYMAANVFEFGPWLDTDEGVKQKSDDRYLAKRIVHATHYDLHGNKGSEICLKDGYDVSPKRFEQLQGKYKEFAPGLEEWQRRTRMEGLRERKLTNAWGRTIEFPYDRAGDDWYRRLYAWRPQSDIARHLNRGWVLFDYLLKDAGFDQLVKVNLQLHDALIFSAPLDQAYGVTKLLVDVLEGPHDYYGEMLVIPAEVKVGLAWGEGVSFKEMPGREEFDSKVKEYIVKKMRESYDKMLDADMAHVDALRG